MRTSFSPLAPIALLSVAVAMSGCSFKQNSDSSSGKAMSPYCATPTAFTNGITLTGTASYQYRNDGDGTIPDGNNTWKPIISGSSGTYSMTIGGHTGSFSCSPGTTTCTVPNIVTNLVANLNSSIGSGASYAAHGVSAVDIYTKDGMDGTVPTVTATNMISQSARPIRFAEIHISDAGGNNITCGETDNNGQFSLQLPNDGAAYTVSVYARSSNSHNSTYVMNNPTDNNPYRVSQQVQSTTNTSVSLVASAKGTMEGGAFNIMDQILNAQDYLRTTTLNCNVSGAPTYFPGCQPVTTIPLVYTYWTPGLTPNAYYGSNSPISYYLIGKSQLFIGGGADGDAINSDGDQFDNSVIVHEYGHSVEDHFGAPDSPGGSHWGTYPIDPRLAWGEGWANFFQAAVTGIPLYRDTAGSVGCGKPVAQCNNVVNFNVSLLAGSAGTSTDTTTVAGEGNFREFSVTRLLFAIIQPSLSQFSEIWTVLNGTSGMRVVDDHIKSSHRFNFIHTNLASSTNKKDWTTALGNEYQTADFLNYATPVDLSASCSTSSIPMTVKRDSWDYIHYNSSGRAINTAFNISNENRNHDFYVYNHPGGALPVSLTWSGSGSVDLDLFVYPANGYVLGSPSSILAYDMRDATGSTTGTATGTTGNASVNPTLPAGRYVIDVMASTASMSYGVNNPTTYSLSIAGHAACPLAQ